MSRMWVFLVSLVLATVAAVAGAEASADKRVALVIGNSAYRNAVALANPERDARAMSDKLKSLGFTVVEGYDLDNRAFQKTIQDFARAVRGADLSMFFYAGHGIQVGGRNYAIPIDAAFEDATALDFEAIPIDLVMKQMENEDGVRLVVLDACRDNPLSRTLARSMSGGTRSTAIGAGLAEVKIADPGKGTAIVFATSPDEVAFDGDGDHSPFTSSLLRNIDAADANLGSIVSRVTGEVYAATKKQQRPWMNASLTGEVFLTPRARVAATVDVAPQLASLAPTAPVVDDKREASLYNLARDSGLAEDYRAYLETYPSGLYAANARNHLARIEREKADKQQVASLAPEPAPSRALAAPLDAALPITDAVKAMVGTAATEAALEFSPEKRKEMQARLKLAGVAGVPKDGAFTGKTREAIKKWQGSIGVPVSGYFNQPQYDILIQRTETAYATYVPEQPASSAPTGRKKPAARAAAAPRERARRAEAAERRPSRRGGGSDDAGRFFGNVVRGVMGF